MVPLHLSAAVATVAVAPLLFIPSLRQLSHLSWLGFVSTLVVMLSVCAAAAADPHRTAAPLQVRPAYDMLCFTDDDCKVQTAAGRQPSWSSATACPAAGARP